MSFGGKTVSNENNCLALLLISSKWPYQGKPSTVHSADSATNQINQQHCFPANLKPLY